MDIRSIQFKQFFTKDFLQGHVRNLAKSSKVKKAMKKHSERKKKRPVLVSFHGFLRSSWKVGIVSAINVAMDSTMKLILVKLNIFAAQLVSGWSSTL